jgi:hypothetical protein
VITNIENNRASEMTVAKLVALSSALKVKPSDIDPRLDQSSHLADIAAARRSVELAQALLDGLLK